MKCPRCQRENAPPMAFCGACGTPLTANPSGALASSYSELGSGLSEAREQQAATAEILRAIASSPTNLGPTFATILDRAMALVGAQLGVLWRYEGDEVFRAVEVRGASPESMTLWQQPQRIGRPFFRTNGPWKPGQILDVRETEPYRRRDPLWVSNVEQEGVRTLLAVPLVSETRYLGAILLWRQEVRAFTEKEIALLQTFADQAVIAIENVRLFNETKEALEQQTATAEILRVISSSPTDLQPVMDTVAENAIRLCEAERALIFRFDGEVMRVVATHNVFPELRAFIEQNPITPGRGSGIGRAALERRTIHIHDIRTDPEYTYAGQQIAPYRTVLVVPMLRAGELLGIIAIHRHEVRPFTDSQIALMETFADQAAIAIENVRLFTELRTRTAELTRSVAQVTALGEVSRAVKFCDRCGAPLAATPPHPAAAAPRFGPPESYTPKHLAEKILTSKSALEGERKQVTVLFADLKGSMELLADRDPEEARKLLDPVLERMMEAVHRYEGTVNQVMGDGIMALFGAPVAHEDHAVRGCYAALRMQEAVKRYAADVQRAQGLPLHIRVGLNSGPVVVRSIGSDLRMDYTAVGQTTHLAARMEQTAMPGSILMTGETLRAAEGYVQVRALGPVHIKGLADPVEAFEVTGAGLARTRLQAATARGLTRFVGREHELDHLRQALERARAGHGQVVALVGEPGVGKSRLVLEFTHSHRTEGWLRLEASSVSYGKATPYLPAIDLLKAYFQIEAGDEGRRVREKITGKLLTLDRALEPALPAVLALLDVLGDDASWQALDPPQRRQRTLDAVKRLLLRENQVQPLLLVFEDLHWIDTETQAFLDILVESLPTARLLMLVNYRPEYQHGWGSRTAYSQLRLDPLPPETAGELLRALLGDDRTLEPLARLLIARTEGNPFFLEESVRTLVETKALVGERGAYRVVTPLHDLQVPATVEAILAARIDRLPAEDKRLLQVAAVIGKTVPFGLLQAVADLPEDDLERGLARLQAAEFLYESSLFPEREYTFKHALTHEVAYRGLLQDRRRAIHAKLVVTLERLGGDRSTEQVEQLAHHAFRAEAWDKAVTYLRQAGGKATERSAYAEAVARFEQALEALGHLPESRERLAEAIDLRLNLHGALYPLGELERTLAHLREAESAAEALGDQPRLGLVSAHLTFCHSWVGDLDRAVATGERALAIASTLQDVPLRVVASGRLGQAYFDAGEFRRAVELFGPDVERLEGDLVHDRFGGLTFIASVFSRGYLARCLAALGDFVPARASIEKAVSKAEAAHHPYSITVAYWLSAMPLLLQGDFPKAIFWLECCQDLCRRDNTPLLFWIVTRLLGEAYARSERLAEGLPLLEQAAEQFGSLKNMRWYPGTVSALGTAYLLAGRPADALQSVRRALQLSQAYKQPGVEAEALRVLGDIHAGHVPPDVAAADAAYRQALALAEPRGMRPLAAHCHLGLGKLYHRIGKNESARKHLQTATTMYREMGMTFWLEQTDAETGSAL